MSILLVSLFSWDSFPGLLVLGFGLRSNWRRIGLAAAFGLCDALASTASRHILAFDANDGTDLQTARFTIDVLRVDARQAL